MKLRQAKEMTGRRWQIQLRRVTSGMNAAQRRKWSTYSERKKQRMLEKIGRAAKKKSRFQRESSTLQAERSQKFSDTFLRTQDETDGWKEAENFGQRMRRWEDPKNGQRQSSDQKTAKKRSQSEKKAGAEWVSVNRREPDPSGWRIYTRNGKRPKADFRELLGVIDRDIRRSEQIRQQIREDQIQQSEAAYDTAKAAVSISLMPLQIRYEKMRKAVRTALRHVGASMIKYMLPVFGLLFLAVLLYAILMGLIGGIAGSREEEAVYSAAYGASGEELVEYAKQWIGVTRYVWGAGRNSVTDWQDYADCSSFAHGVFAHFGYEIGGTTYTQEAAGVRVSGGLSAAQPGDLILFYSGSIAAGNSSHVGIYTGNGQMVHCSGGHANTFGNPGRGVCIGSVAADGRRYVVRRVAAASKTGSGYRRDPSAYSSAQMELIWAIVAQEDNGSYAGALAVISSAMNRTESAQWRSLGSTALAQLTAPGQYCYSNDSYWRHWLGGNVPAYVKQAVWDCLKRGARNHRYTSFRSRKGSQTGANAVQIGGNWYFGS